MIYLLFEDSTSAKSFWTGRASLFLKEYTIVEIADNDSAEVKDKCGNLNLKSKLQQVAKQLTKNDSLFVIFDNVNSFQFVVVSFLQTCLDVCRRAEASFIYTSYYCFEELFLAYTAIQGIFNEQMLLEICNEINNGCDYTELPTVQEFLEENNLSSLNREKIGNVILSRYTQRIRGDFQIAKKAFIFKKAAKCWVEDCSLVKREWSNTHKVNKICNDCYYGQQCSLSDQKYKHILLNSLFIPSNWISKCMCENKELANTMNLFK